MYVHGVDRKPREGPERFVAGAGHQRLVRPVQLGHRLLQDHDPELALDRLRERELAVDHGREHVVDQDVVPLAVLA